MHQLTIVPGKPGLAEAGVSLCRVPVDALTTVVARVVQTLIPIHAALTVVGHLLTTGTPISWKGCKKGKEKRVEGIRRVGLVIVLVSPIKND